MYGEREDEINLRFYEMLEDMKGNTQETHRLVLLDLTLLPVCDYLQDSLIS